MKMTRSDCSSQYYQNSIKIPYASNIGLHVRKKIFSKFLEGFHPTKFDSVLDVGVTSEKTLEVSNFFEKLYPFPENITCIGTEDGSHLEEVYPGARYIRVFPNKPLPFDDNQFDLAFSNAVVEHTGKFESQRFFINEICRVSKKFFVVTPNRWFPFETHTGLPLIHFLPKFVFRKILISTRYSFWSSEDNLNLLGLKEFRLLFPDRVSIQTQKIRFFGMTSNLIIFGSKIPLSSGNKMIDSILDEIC